MVRAEELKLDVLELEKDNQDIRRCDVLMENV